MIEYQGLNECFRFVAVQTAACQEASMMTAMLTGFRDRPTLLPERGLSEIEVLFVSSQMIPQGFVGVCGL